MRFTTLQSDRCTTDDFEELFVSCENQFHWLCYMLTGNLDRASQTLNHALQASFQSATRIFREWIMKWARREIIKACILQMHGDIQRAARSLSPGREKERLQQGKGLYRISRATSEGLEASILALDALSRFVVVLRDLEGYSRRETLLLLGVDETTCDLAHELALLSMSFPWQNTRVESRVTTG